MPAGFPMPSQKIRGFIRAFMTLAPNFPTAAATTSSLGYVMWRPTLASDVTCVTYTNGGPPTTTLNGGTPFNDGNWQVTNAPMVKLPYTASQFTAQTVEGRLVSGCVRVRYTGTETARGGSISLFEDPDHLSVATQSINGINTFDSCGKERPRGDGTWSQINWSGPAKQKETEYVIDDGQVGAGFPIVGAFAPPCVIIAINQADAHAAGASTNQTQVYEFEVWQNMEYIGRDVPGKTNNEFDQQGSGAVWSAGKIASSQQYSLAPTGPAANIFRAELRKQAAELGKKTFAPKQGGSFGGNLFNSVVSSVHPTAGLLLKSFRRSRNPTIV